jgi:hypothetical protein
MSEKHEKMFLIRHLKCFGDFNHDPFCECPLKRECDEEALKRMLEFAEDLMMKRSRGKR